MEKPKKESFFWASYSDLMTSMFFVMLVLFVLMMALAHRKISNIEEELIKEKQIKEIHKAVSNLDSIYFEYKPEYKKHIFKLEVKYPTGVFDIYQITDKDLLYSIKDAGETIKEKILSLPDTLDIQYLVIVEGQASKDDYYKNDFLNNNVLSYQRAWKLTEFWKSNGIDFESIKKCELIIAGSGEKGLPRDTINEENNQRFLIQIVPKIGEIKPKT